MRAWLLLLVCSACAAAPRAAAPSHEAPVPAEAPVAFTITGGQHYRPAGAPATRYAETPPAGAPSELEAQVGALLAAAGASPSFDARLSAVAADVAAFSSLAPVAPTAAVELSLSHHGLVESMPQWIVIESSSAELADDLVELGERLPGALAGGSWARAGVAFTVVGEGSRLVLGLQRVSVELSGLPRRLDVGGSVEVTGRLKPGFSRAELYVADPDGKVQQLASQARPSGFAAQLVCARVGRLDVEIHATDASGAGAVVARFPVYCGSEPPLELQLPIAADEALATPEELEQQIFAELNAARRAARLPELTWDEQGATMAREHSRSMQGREHVSHVSPAGGVLERARAAGLGGLLVTENIALAGSAAEASAGLLMSSSQRTNRLSRHVTHAGIGVVVAAGADGRPRLWLTEVFLRRAPALDAKQARELAEAALVVARERAGTRSLLPDGGLSAVAAEHAAGLARGTRLDEVRDDAELGLERLCKRFGRAVTIEQVVGHPSLLEDPRFVDAAWTHYGLGVAIAPHPLLGEGAFYVVVVLARPRPVGATYHCPKS